MINHLGVPYLFFHVYNMYCIEVVFLSCESPLAGNEVDD